MFRFSIRELMLVIVVAVMGVAWWVDRHGLTRRGKNGKEVADKEIETLKQDFEAKMTAVQKRAAWESETLKEEIKEMGAEFEIDQDGIHIKYEYPNGAKLHSFRGFHP
jgi:Tfp pilus assembly protein PilO